MIRIEYLIALEIISLEKEIIFDYETNVKFESLYCIFDQKVNSFFLLWYHEFRKMIFVIPIFLISS